jgi:dihydroorotase
MERLNSVEILLTGLKCHLDREWKPVDILVKNGVITAIKDAGSGLKAGESMSLAGCYIVPGWTDLHAHLYPLRKGGVGTKESRIGLSSGVTTLLDVGTVGVADFEDFKASVIDRSETRILALLNIKSRGIRFWSLATSAGEDNLDRMAEMAGKYPELIKGVKVTASSEHMDKADPMYYVRKAIEAGDRLKLPVMVHIGRTPPELEEILPLMRKGDILTHVFRNADHHILDGSGKIRKSVLAARDRGVLFDIGHGVLSFSFHVLEKALEQGFDDFTISSDLYILSVPYRARSFANVLSKFLAAGMSLESVMERAAAKPAKLLGIKNRVGEGEPAEFTVFRLAEGDFTFKDCWGLKRSGKQFIRPVLAASRGKLFKL